MVLHFLKSTLIKIYLKPFYNFIPLQVKTKCSFISHKGYLQFTVAALGGSWQQSTLMSKTFSLWVNRSEGHTCHHLIPKLATDWWNVQYYSNPEEKNVSVMQAHDDHTENESVLSSIKPLLTKAPTACR